MVRYWSKVFLSVTPTLLDDLDVRVMEMVMVSLFQIGCFGQGHGDGHGLVVPDWMFWLKFFERSIFP